MIRRIRERTEKIAFISSYSPRKCGIATFTSDLINNLGLAGSVGFEPVVIAMESGAELKYDEPVKLTIRRDVKYDYIRAADYINFSDVDAVSVQHEFGLFGGDGGSHLSILLKRLNKPVIMTLHTILEDPSAEYFDSLTDVCMASDKVIVMNKRGIRMLRDIYGVSEQKIKLIPHGIPDLPFTHNGYYKRKLCMAGRRTILTFGLLPETWSSFSESIIDRFGVLFNPKKGDCTHEEAFQWATNRGEIKAGRCAYWPRQGCAGSLLGVFATLRSSCSAWVQ